MYRYAKKHSVLPSLAHTAACRQIIIKRVHRVIPNIMHNTATVRRCAMPHSDIPPVANLAPLTARCVSVAEHHTAEEYSKTDRTKPRKHLPGAIYHEYSLGIPEDTNPSRI